MSNKLVAVRPADLNPDTLNWYNLGTLLVNKLTGDLYMVIEKNGQKIAQLVGGAGRYEMAHHISLSHVIQNFAPTKFDYGTVWYNTSMVYVEPSDAQEAYITVRAELSPGVFGWKTILPISHAEQVIVGKDNSNNPYTLKQYIEDTKRRTINPPTSVTEAVSGEIYIKTEDNTLWWKTGPNPEDQYKIGDANPFILEKLRKTIHLKDEHPSNWDPESLWLKDGGDASIVDAMSVAVRKSNADFSGGYKWNTGNKAGVVLSAFDKVATIDLNNTQSIGFFLGNFNLATEEKYYLEFFIKDPEKKLKLLFFNSNPDMNMTSFGTQLDQASMLIDTTKRKLAAVDYAKDFNWDNKTIFVMVDKPNKKVSLGFVNDDGTLNYVHQNITYITSYIGIASDTSTTANAKSSIAIRSYKVSSIPLGYKAINNILPEETAFENIAPLTNAQSVYIDKNTTLGHLHAGAGRLITTPRDYLNKNDSLPGEVMVDYKGEILYVKKPDGTLFKIGGGNDDIFLNHVNNSLEVIHGDLSAMEKDENNLSKMYISEADLNMESYKNTGKVLYGKMGVIDNSPDGTNDYKIYIPYTDTTTTSHTWDDFISGVSKTGSTKQYLDLIADILKNNLKTKFFYRGYLELFTADDIVNRFNTKSLFLTELKANNIRFTKESVYLQSIKTKGSNRDTTNPSLTKIYEFFDVPEDGQLVIHKDDKNKISIDLLTESNNRYLGFITPKNEIRWDRVVTEKNGVINTSASIVSTSSINAETIEANDYIKAGSFSSSKANSGWYVFDENNNNYKNIIKHTVDNGKTTITIGDSKTNTSLGLASIERPTWDVFDASTNAVIKYPLALYSELKSGWTFKGELSDRSGLIDLNNLKNEDNVGYYVLSTSNSQISANYPIDNNAGFLHVMKSGDYVIQSFNTYDKDTGKAGTYTRSFDKTANRWNDWIKTVSEQDLDGKYDKTGGVISGNVIANENITVGKNINLNTGNVRLSEGNIVDNTDKRLIGFKTITADKFTEVGNLSHKSTNIFGNVVPRWATEEIVQGTSNKVMKYYNFALEKDLRALDEDTYSKQEVNDLIAKINLTPITRELGKKLSKEGDTGTGDYIFTGGNVTINDLRLKSGKIEIPSLDVNSKEISNLDGYKTTIKDLGSLATNNRMKDNFNSIVLRYSDSSQGGAKVETSSLNFSISAPANNSNNYISNIILSADSKGELYYGKVTNKDFNTFSPVRIIKSDNVIDNLISTSVDNPLSANQGRILHSLVTSKNRGALNSTYTGRVFNIQSLKGLGPANYYINSDEDFTKLNLNKDKVTYPGILVVMSELTNTGKIMAYIPSIGDKMAFINLPTTASTSDEVKWIYLKDYSDFLTKGVLDEKMRELVNSTLGYVVVEEYAYTGNTTNNTLPYRLVHTHNHNGANITDNTSPIKFNTNINLSSAGLDSEEALVMIKLDGYSYVDSTPIQLIMSITLRGKNSMSIVEEKSDITYMTPGSITVTPTITNGNLSFVVSNERGTQDLTFDTHIRINKLNNLSFEPKVTGFSLDDTTTTPSHVVNKTKRVGGLFSNV